MVRRNAFLGGLVLGSGLCAWLLAAALIYFYTGKMASIETGGGKGLRLVLTDGDSLYKMRSPDREKLPLAGKEGR